MLCNFKCWLWLNIQFQSAYNCWKFVTIVENFILIITYICLIVCSRTFCYRQGFEIVKDQHPSVDSCSYLAVGPWLGMLCSLTKRQILEQLTTGYAQHMFTEQGTKLCNEAILESRNKLAGGNVQNEQTLNLASDSASQWTVLLDLSSLRTTTYPYLPHPLYSWGICNVGS